MSRPLAIALGTALALLAAQPAVAAKYYKWVDEDGVTHYTQQPPPEDARVETDAATLPASTPDAPPGGDAGAGDGQSGQSEADGEGEDESDDEGPKTVAEFCERLRGEEQKLASDRPVRTKNADGELEPLEGEARQQRLQRVRSQLQQHCQGEEGQTADAE